MKCTNMAESSQIHKINCTRCIELIHYIQSKINTDKFKINNKGAAKKLNKI